MHVEVALSGSVMSVEALARFLRDLERLVPAPTGAPKVVMGDDGVIYVKAEFATEEAWQVGKRWRQLAPRLLKTLTSSLYLRRLPGDARTRYERDARCAD